MALASALSCASVVSASSAGRGSRALGALAHGAQPCSSRKAAKMVVGLETSGRGAKMAVIGSSPSGVCRRRIAVAALQEGVAVDVNAPPSVLVDTLLSLVEGTDRGTQIGEATKRAIDEIVNKLETLCIPEPLSSPLLFGDWDVAYSSNPTAPGGYYRSMLGRAVLKTRDMVQSINAPDAITNKVAFAAFGILDGQVTLQGKLTVLDKQWVEVVFEAPEVKVGALKVQYGGTSNVKLAILYLDEVVRIGRGSRGSLFVFRRRS